MTSRIGSPDTVADAIVRDCLTQEPPQSFVMVAGAGSGKTTSLIKTLAHIANICGPRLRRAGQKIACITYTEVAVGEISDDLGALPLFHISTIHSFLWSVISPFQSDIAAWVKARIIEKIDEKQDHHDKPRTQKTTKTRLLSEIAALHSEHQKINTVTQFTYGTGSNYLEGILGHDDILKMVPACIHAQPLLRRVIASRFPYIFVDESQDTNPEVVKALRLVAQEHAQLCIGFFGDPMQEIYTSGVGTVTPDATWQQITKAENFRCPMMVRDVINAIRLTGDGLQQTRGRATIVDGQEIPVVGSANLFILPADEQRSARLAAVRQWLADELNDDLWLNDAEEGNVRLLVLVHRMAAKRLGFSNLFSAFNDKGLDNFKEGFKDGSAWPLRPVMKQILPLVMAARSRDAFSVMSILRRHSPRLARERLAAQAVAPVLAELQQAVDRLTGLLADDSQATLREVILHVHRTQLLRLDDRFTPHLHDQPADHGQADFTTVQNYLACETRELWAYHRYQENESAYATQQGVKGAQFDRVLVVIDDEEGRHMQFSYGKYFGYVPLSDKDQEKSVRGVESVVDRTRRLFYVCCSRARKDLAVVIFVPDVTAARAAIEKQGVFLKRAIHGPEVLGRACP
jgi:DNA helicase-2/ATP-dependent DNA helicase PcrA